MPFPGDPRLRRARPRRQVMWKTPGGYGLVRKQVVARKKMRERYIPQGIMTFLGHQFGGLRRNDRV